MHLGRPNFNLTLRFITGVFFLLFVSIACKLHLKVQFTHYISAYHYHILTHVASYGLVCDEPFCEVISVSLHMSVITGWRLCTDDGCKRGYD